MTRARGSVMDLRHLDQSLLLAINGFAHRSLLLDKTAVVLLDMDFLKGGFFFVFLWWLWFREEADPLQNRLAVLRIAGGLFLAVVVARAMQILLPARVRPMHDPAIHLVAPLVPVPEGLEHWSSFPSDHAVVFFAVAAAIWLYNRWLGLFAAAWITVFACLPRVFVGFHYPSDILAGAIVGAVITCVAMRVPLPRIVLAEIDRLLAWERSRPQIFYCAAVVVTFELMMMCNDLRIVGRAVAQVL
jgi:undecaprenyl-diphosphatase